MGPVNIEQFIKQNNFITQSTGDFREASVTKPATRGGDRASGKKQKPHSGLQSKRLEQNYMPKKQVISPYKVGVQVSSGQDHSQSTSAQGSLKSHVNQLQPYSAMKAAQSRQARRNSQNRLAPKQHGAGNPTPAHAQGGAKGLMRQSATASQGKKQPSPHKSFVQYGAPAFADLPMALSQQPSKQQEEDPSQPHTFAKSSTNKNEAGSVVQMTQMYLDQYQIFKQTQQSLWDQRRMLQEASRTRKPKPPFTETKRQDQHPFA